MTTPNPNIESYEPDKVYIKLGRSLRTKLTPLDKRLWDVVPAQTPPPASPTTADTPVPCLPVHSPPPTKLSSNSVAQKADQLKPSLVQFHRVPWWEFKRRGEKFTYGINEFLELLKKEIEIERFEEEGATGPFETKAINDLLVPVPNATATYAFPRTEEDVSPVFQALGKIIRAIHPNTTRKQKTDVSKSVMLECRSEVHKSTPDGFSTAMTMEENPKAEPQANKSEGSSKGTEPNNIATSFLEVKRSRLSLKTGANSKGTHKRYLDNWLTTISAENSLRFIYPQVLRYNETHNTKYGALTDHDLTTLIYVEPSKTGNLDVYWSPVPQDNVIFAFAFYNWLALKAKGLDHNGLLRKQRKEVLLPLK
ncbi:hypothetical protein BT69DRAFT_1297198 [Atractiella rhizophila]|nr:hypothetical protein BT69DRAFT_1297198 [Atractiella rhizophila]